PSLRQRQRARTQAARSRPARAAASHGTRSRRGPLQSRCRSPGIARCRRARSSSRRGYAPCSMLVLVSARALFLAGLPVATPTLQVRSEQILPLPYNQGIARVDGGWLLSGTRSPLPDTDVLVRTDDDLEVAVEVDKAIPEPYRSEGYNHVG